MNVVDFARQIIAMQDKIADLQWENERLRKYERDYNELLNESLTHNQRMVGNMLSVLMTPGVTEAFAKNAEAKTFNITKFDPPDESTGFSLLGTL